MQIKPLFDRVLLKAEAAETGAKSAGSGGVYVPRDANERSQLMIVESVGMGIDESGNKTEMAVSVGDKVLVSKYAGAEITIDGQKFWIFKQCDILAKLTKD